MNEIKELLSIGMKDDRFITCQMVNPFGFDELIASSICSVMMDYLISNVPEDKQIDFEKKTYQLFCETFDKRFEYIEHLDNDN